MKSSKWTEQEIKFLLNNYKDMDNKELSEKLGRSKSAVINKLHQQGIKRECKYNYNKDYFEIIDTYDKAYWLGFIYADGCVIVNKEKRNREFCIKLQKEDDEHLRKLNKCLDGNVPVTYQKRQTFVKYGYDKYYECCMIRFYNKKMILDLMDKGVIQSKTYDLKLPDLDNDELLWCFIRGFMDGDGHICLPNNTGYGYRVGFTCFCKDFLESLQSFFKKYGIDSYINLDKKDGHIYKLEIRNKQSLKIYLDNCYKNGDMYLDRKFKRYKTLYKLLH